MSPSLEQRLTRDTSFERLYRRHRRDVYGAVLRDVRDPDEAEDVTQIAFLNAFRAIRRGEEPEKPRAWLVTIARNVVRRRYHALARRPQEVALDPDVAADLADVDGPTAGEIAAAIRRLSANQRAVILLREIQGRSYAEIADELELSGSAVETLIFRARRSLSAELQVADHAPVTQRRTRGLRGLLALPLPGLGKLSIGFSLSRAGVAAFMGGVAIVTVPIADLGAEAPGTASGRRAPSAAEPAGAFLAPVIQFVPSAKTKAASAGRQQRTKKHRGDKGTASQVSSIEAAAEGAAAGLAAPVVGGSAPSPVVQTPPVQVVTPALPVQTPPLPVQTPPVAVQTPALPVKPPALPPPPVEVPLPVEPP